MKTSEMVRLQRIQARIREKTLTMRDLHKKQEDLSRLIDNLSNEASDLVFPELYGKLKKAGKDGVDKILRASRRKQDKSIGCCGLANGKCNNACGTARGEGL